MRVYAVYTGSKLKKRNDYKLTGTETRPNECEKLRQKENGGGG